MILDQIRKRTSPGQRRFIKFCVVGSSGVVVNLVVMWLTAHALAGTMEATLVDVAASAVGILVSVFTNFVINDVWTWGDRQKGRRRRDFLGRVARYYIASGLAIAIQFGTAQTLVFVVGFDKYLAQVLGILLGTAFNYVANNRWTFRHHDTTPQRDHHHG
ncbi:MAG: GtrA family protein [Deltaproteobacteria bacterium]|nr:GtrA family protein [Deltaproteobacteria bacterium]